jgi:hypothetical protein
LGEGTHWIRDLDLAERAGLAKPRDVRATIEGCIKDGLISRAEIGAAAADANLPAVAREETEVVTSGKGRTQEVTVYYLNEEAALLLVTRLRTSKAIELTKAIVRVFLLAVQGRLEPPVPPAPKPLPAPAPELDSASFQRAELIVRSVGLMSPAVSPEAKDVMLARAIALLTGQPSTPLLPALPPGRWRRPSEMAKELGVSENAIGRALTALGFREQEEHRLRILDQKRHGEGQVVCYLWSETVFEALQRHFERASITA